MALVRGLGMVGLGLVLASCSVVFSGSKYQGGGATDGGRQDAEDSGTDAGCTVDSGCLKQVPSYVGAEHWGLLRAAGTKALVLDMAHFVINTDTGAIDNMDAEDSPVRPVGTGVDAVSGVGFTKVSQATGPKLGVFYAASFTVSGGANVQVVGKNAFVLLTSGDIDVTDGTVDAGAVGEVGGPGGHTAAAPGTNPSDSSDGVNGERGIGEGTGLSGGGGGASAFAGGKGGDDWRNSRFQTGSAGGTGFEVTSLLRGGGSGGRSAGGILAMNNTCCESAILGPMKGGGDIRGGGGGGAVLLVSATNINVSDDGVIGVPGGGGGVEDHPTYMKRFFGSGAGGGAGGTLVLEAPVIEVSGALTANGGGGSGGDATKDKNSVGTRGALSKTSMAEGGEGQPGLLGTDPNTVMMTPPGGGEGGGASKAEGSDAPTKINGVTGYGFGGGGGGGAGRVLLHSAGARTLTNAVCSPKCDLGDLPYGQIP